MVSSGSALHDDLSKFEIMKSSDANISSPGPSDERPSSPLGASGDAHNGYSSDSSVELVDVSKMDPATLQARIKAQVEYYFSQQNLVKDNYMVAQMNSDGYIPVSVIAGFKKVQKLTEDLALIVTAMADSTVCELSEDRTALKTVWKRPARTTIILRDVHVDTTEDDIKALFDKTSYSVVSARSDVGQTWFVTMASEEDAKNAVLHLLSKTLHNQAVKARLKSEALRPTLSAGAGTFTPAGQQPLNVAGAPQQFGTAQGYQPYGNMQQGYGNQYYNQIGGWNTQGVSVPYGSMDPMQQQHVNMGRRHSQDQKKYAGGPKKRINEHSGSTGATDKRGVLNSNVQHKTTAFNNGGAVRSNARRPIGDRQQQNAASGGNAGGQHPRKTKGGNKALGAGLKKTAQTPNFTAQDFPTLSGMSKLALEETGGEGAAPLTADAVAAHVESPAAVTATTESPTTEIPAASAETSNADSFPASSSAAETKVVVAAAKVPSSSWAAAVAKAPLAVSPQQVAPTLVAAAPAAGWKAGATSPTSPTPAANASGADAAKFNAEERPKRGWEKPDVIKKIATDVVDDVVGESVNVVESSEHAADSPEAETKPAVTVASPKSTSWSDQIDEDGDIVVPNGAGDKATLKAAFGAWGGTKKSFADIIKSETAAGTEAPAAAQPGTSRQPQRPNLLAGGWSGTSRARSSANPASNSGVPAPNREGSAAFGKIRKDGQRDARDQRDGPKVDSLESNWRRDSRRKPLSSNK